MPAEPASREAELRARYLELLKDTLCGMIFQDKPSEIVLANLLIDRAPQRFVKAFRRSGRDMPSLAHTAIGRKRLDNLQLCLETVIADDVPGDAIETGVWRGGATILMRGVFQAWGETERTVWVADSFEGLPAPDPERYPLDEKWKVNAGRLAVSLDEVRDTFARYGLLDDRVRFLKGWFEDTLPSAPIRQLAVLRLDGDLYQSTMDALSALYPKLQSGGFVIVDDYNITACRQAITDYRKRCGIDDPILDIDGWAVYWRRQA
jgi:hypothetical protein